MIYGVDNPLHHSPNNTLLGGDINLVGPETEMLSFTSGLAAMALSATQLKRIDVATSSEFIANLAQGYIDKDNRTTLYRLLDQSTEFITERSDSLIITAAAGYLSSVAVLHEMSSMNGFLDGEDAEGHLWLTSTGLSGTVLSDGRIDPNFSYQHEAPDLIAYASRLTRRKLSGLAYQHELVADHRKGTASVLTDRWHYSIGMIRVPGTYTPVVTLLHADHPVMELQNSSPEAV